MPQILQNLAEMTGHRDHLRLEASVLTTLQTLGSITSARALELFTHEGKAQLRPRTWIDEGRLTSTDVDACS
ncbi:MAG: GGDEF domain-containing protein, partial [Burkholderiaceae bacterium]|nr:GGDEF domain-containing protein [Burkholderiaceae bacterium]